MATLTLLAGLPGSGKSTWLQSQREPSTTLVLTADAIRERGSDPAIVFRELYARARAKLTKGGDVVVDACSLRQFERARWMRLALIASPGVRLELVVFDTPFDEARRRDAMRTRPAAIDWEHARLLVARLRAEVAREGWHAIRWVRAGPPQRRTAPRHRAAVLDRRDDDDAQDPDHSPQR